MSGFIRNRLDRDLIVLGGPAKNEAARAFLENFRTDYSLTRFNFDDVTDTIEIEPEGGAPFSVKDFAPSMANGYPLRDFGLIVVAARGGQAGKTYRSVLCAGFTTYGTAAAAEFLFGDLVKLSRSSLRNRLGVDLNRRGTSFVAVVSARFSRGECTELRTVYVSAVPFRASLTEVRGAA
ncbi:hypothetical protein ACI2KV_02865 [Micromonospora chokoriensis]